MENILSGGGSPFVGPVFAMMGLTVLVWIWMYVVRIRYMLKNRIDPESLKGAKGKMQLDGPQNWPAENYNHLFEMPVLFYAVCILLVATGVKDDISIGLAWGFVALRAVHSFVHCSYNGVMHRFRLFLVSSLVLFGLIGRAAWMIL